MKLKNKIQLVFLLVATSVFLSACTTRQSNSGISQTGANKNTQGNCISAKESWDYIGDNKCVEYYVGNPFVSDKGNVFLNERKDYKNGFTTVIFNNSKGNFSGDPSKTYGNRTIRVTGNIRTYEGHPEIIVNKPNQITIK